MYMYGYIYISTLTYKGSTQLFKSQPLKVSYTQHFADLAPEQQQDFEGPSRRDQPRGVAPREAINPWKIGEWAWGG